MNNPTTPKPQPTPTAQDSPGDRRQVAGVDTGGTFSDIILREDAPDGSSRVVIHKTLSTPEDPSRAIAQGIAHAAADLKPAASLHLIHGTTVATNALLERRGARVALVTTAGFEDLLELRRQDRPELYNFQIKREPPLVAAPQCFGLRERMAYDGEVLGALEDAEIERVLDALEVGCDGAPFEAVSVCLLHAYANPAHEQRLGRAIAARFPKMHLSLSHEVLPEFREYERASTTTINAYVGPVMARYLHALEGRVAAERIEILQSSGGRCELEFAARFPVNTVLSGPAGGVVGAFAAAEEVGMERIITFDMGGTSSDISLCDAEVPLSAHAEIGELPVDVATLDVRTVGAGGGSIAWVDAGGALRVGPRSAGALPGPACYGRGGVEPTVTDAHVYLGRVRPERFLGGEMTLQAEASRVAIEKLAAELGLEAEAVAQGILEVADANMVRAMKVISLEQGHDPRDFALVAFGGAGGLHACRLAEKIDISTVLIPRNPGLLSAQGMLNADAQRLYSETFLRPLAELLREDDASPNSLRAAVTALSQRARQDLLGPGAVEDASLRYEYSLDLRYEAQSFELNIALPGALDSGELQDPSEDFERQHERLYGYRAPGRAIEVVALRLRAFIPVERVASAQPARASAAAAFPWEDIRVGFRQGRLSAKLIARDDLAEGCEFDGPAVISEYSGTTVVEPGWSVRVSQSHLILTRPDAP
ncbi:hydantoinase/oxoprolinase family protein [Bradymonas sediminis]|uniref:Hydantoinase/oxoprolinase family protein n=1 Tax=Bradymonas sediminis TaxID=1548548 RepID=A0A2Z4FHT1_9DELT|nr:hydantoinase/oxoprolinase family protein [Bradymonas sediminis]AWV88304.1 hydantoinase/oxoprolinase family protein [Bradymonas sediminis]TDP77429.1 N-methylhydantoinase A [Bradymonas sediminis]